MFILVFLWFFFLPLTLSYDDFDDSYSAESFNSVLLQHRFCYQNMGDQTIYLAVDANPPYNSLPKFMYVTVSIKIFLQNSNRIINSYAVYYLKAIDGSCPSTVQISNKDHEFKKMMVHVVAYTGVAQVYFTEIEFYFDSSAKSGVNKFFDYPQTVIFYFDFQTGLSNIIKKSPRVQPLEVRTGITWHKARDNCIHMLIQNKPYVITPQYDNPSISIPNYSAIYMIVVKNNKVVSQELFPAWSGSCSSLPQRSSLPVLVPCPVNDFRILFSFLPVDPDQAEIVDSEFINDNTKIKFTASEVSLECSSTENLSKLTGERVYMIPTEIDVKSCFDGRVILSRKTIAENIIIDVQAQIATSPDLGYQKVKWMVQDKTESIC